MILLCGSRCSEICAMRNFTSRWRRRGSNGMHWRSTACVLVSREMKGSRKVASLMRHIVHRVLVTTNPHLQQQGAVIMLHGIAEAMSAKTWNYPATRYSIQLQCAATVVCLPAKVRKSIGTGFGIRVGWYTHGPQNFSYTKDWCPHRYCNQPVLGVPVLSFYSRWAKQRRGPQPPHLPPRSQPPLKGNWESSTPPEGGKLC